MAKSDQERVVITGMAINTPIGDELSPFLDSLLAGKSAISKWKFFDSSRVYGKVGADLSGYDIPAKVAALEGKLDPGIFARTRKLAKKAPWSTKLSVLLAADAWQDSQPASGVDMENVAALITGHNLNTWYGEEQRRIFEDEPDFLDAMYSLVRLDTNHAGCVSEALGSLGPSYTVGAACASGNAALRLAVDEVRHHGATSAVVVGPVLEFAPMDLHGLALMGAITYQSFNETPELASRPYDTRREGFVPAHGGAALVLETLASARARGARAYAEILACEGNSDGSHLPQPSEDGQHRLMKRVLSIAGLAPEQIDYVNAHATSTPLGDVTELRAIKRIFGAHAKKLKINATKSMLGHTCWASAVVETVAAVLQMQRGMLHPSINIENLDPEVDLDVCRGKAVPHEVRYLMKDSFGFGGVNAISILGQPPADLARVAKS
jgi:3-oxoacyl-(acyl-carrier-protein) synthase